MTGRLSMPTVIEDLEHYGPGQAGPPPTREQAWDYCAKLTKSHYENFSVVTWMTPPRLRPAFQSIYAFCRWSDDLGDELGDRDHARDLLDWWRDQLHLTLKDPRSARHPVLIALAETVAEHNLPHQPFDDLISAFRQDQTITRYHNDADLFDYCRRSANPVGRLLLHLANRVTDETLQMSDSICTGLQLANFWQDVRRDSEIDRIYLPRSVCDLYGVREEQILAGRMDQAFARMLQDRVDQARQFLNVGRDLPGALPGRLAIDIELFRRGGLAILDRIESLGYDVLSSRPKVGKLTKLGLLFEVSTRWFGRSVIARSSASGLAPPSASSRLETKDVAIGDPS